MTPRNTINNLSLFSHALVYYYIYTKIRTHIHILIPLQNSKTAKLLAQTIRATFIEINQKSSIYSMVIFFIKHY